MENGNNSERTTQNRITENASNVIHEQRCAQSTRTVLTEKTQKTFVSLEIQVDVQPMHKLISMEIIVW